MLIDMGTPTRFLFVKFQSLKPMEVSYDPGLEMQAQMACTYAKMKLNETLGWKKYKHQFE
jgi:hypothetical protein